MSGLPEWPEGSAGVLCVAGPHAIPVSTALRAGDRRVLLALGRRRDALARLREEPQAALCLLARGLAFTAHGHARVVREELEAARGVAALELVVERVQDHLADGRTEMLSAAGWRWLDPDAAAADARISAELRGLAERR